MLPLPFVTTHGQPLKVPAPFNHVSFRRHNRNQPERTQLAQRQLPYAVCDLIRARFAGERPDDLSPTNNIVLRFTCDTRSEEHTSELQSLRHLVCRLLLDTHSTVIYTLSLHDALPICSSAIQSRVFPTAQSQSTGKDAACAAAASLRGLRSHPRQICWRAP